MQIAFHNSAQMTNAFAVYRIDVILGDGPYQLAFVGVDQMFNLFRARQAYQSPVAAKALRVATAVCLTVLSLHDTADAAQTAQDAAVAALNPPGNQPESAAPRKGGKPRALIRSDGAHFASVTAAARAIGVHPPNIHHHLAARYGHATVKGYTFRMLDTAAGSSGAEVIDRYDDED